MFSGHFLSVKLKRLGSVKSSADLIGHYNLALCVIKKIGTNPLTSSRRF